MKYIYYYYYYILVREFLKRWRLEQARIVSQYSRSFYTKVIKKNFISDDHTHRLFNLFISSKIPSARNSFHLNEA